MGNDHANKARVLSEIIFPENATKQEALAIILTQIRATYDFQNCLKISQFYELNESEAFYQSLNQFDIQGQIIKNILSVLKLLEQSFKNDAFVNKFYDTTQDLKQFLNIFFEHSSFIKTLEDNTESQRYIPYMIRNIITKLIIMKVNLFVKKP